jgi:SAM-dependent methyltransferase
MTTLTNLEEYDDPEIYDQENADFEPDGDFYLAYAQQIGGAVLELGCGTGRITIPMAQQGVNITGIDIVPQMIEQAKAKAVNLPIQWITADVRDFSAEQTFRLIFESGATFQHMLTRADQERMLARVRQHLEPEGRFIVSTMMPSLDLLADQGEQEWFSYENREGREVRVSGTQHFDWLTQIKTETAIRRWKDASGQEIIKHTPLSLRYTFPQETEVLLHYNGFVILESFGDWDKSPLTGKSGHIIHICRAVS